jgi:GxxExxY protein
MVQVRNGTGATGGVPFDLQRLNALTERIIGCAIELHKQLGAGLLESIYENALCLELDLAGLEYQRQVATVVRCRGQIIGEHRLDLIVEDLVVVELKSVERMDPVFQAQVLSYLKVSGKGIGLPINFNSRLLSRGIQRFIL